MTMHRVEPNGTVGILGGGQLGRMLALAAARLGLKTIILCPDDDCPAAACSAEFIHAAYDDEAALSALASKADIITYEFENVPAETVRLLTKMDARIAPGEKALSISQDRLIEKQFVRSIGAGTAPFFAVDSLDDLENGLRELGRPCILKTRRLGYDGKGQTRIDDLDTNIPGAWEQAKTKAWEEIGASPSILEGFIDFTAEISILGARRQDGLMAFYDAPRNGHENGILRSSRVPSGVAASTIATARDIAGKMLTELDYVGVIGVEFFVQPDGGVLVNEFAPRVHNSGHWTGDACGCSQFEQHIRAVCGWPLGSTKRHSDAEMTNLIGSEVDDWAALAGEENVCVHLYGKAEARLGRKMGHTTKLLPLS